ncbi:hypothetical protein [Pedobacter borealis]|uniref:hypothetical protein n=1 Tax=Pedobacter borealis TaxID=475254 RepID=UPI0012FAE107|nr:hypothetical protein [Pedobacter borealis]
MRQINKNKNEHLDSRMLSYAARMLFIAALAALIVIIGMQQSCSRLSGMEGVYVNSAGSEFSVANDTLVVEESEGNQYLIHRKTGFRLISQSGVLGKLQHEAEEWTADYDSDSGVLLEKRHGKSIVFNTDYSVMTVGKRKYQRVN